MNAHALKAILRLAKCINMLADEKYDPKTDVGSILQKLNDTTLDALEFSIDLAEVVSLTNDENMIDFADKLVRSYYLISGMLEEQFANIPKMPGLDKPIEQMTEEEVGEAFTWIPE